MLGIKKKLAKPKLSPYGEWKAKVLSERTALEQILLNEPSLFDHWVDQMHAQRSKWIKQDKNEYFTFTSY